VIVASQNNRAVNPLVLQWASSDQSVARVSPGGGRDRRGAGQGDAHGVGPAAEQEHRGLGAPRGRGDGGAAALLGRSAVAAHRDAEIPKRQALAADKTPIPEAPLRWFVADPASLRPQTGTLTGRLGKTTLVVRGGWLAVTCTSAEKRGRNRHPLGHAVHQRPRCSCSAAGPTP